MLLVNQFCYPKKMYEYCGMFSLGHMILLIISLLILSFLLVISRNINLHEIKILT